MTPKELLQSYSNGEMPIGELKMRLTGHFEGKLPSKEWLVDFICHSFKNNEAKVLVDAIKPWYMMKLGRG